VRAAGGTFKDIVKINNYCVASVDPAALTAFREVRDRYVNTKAPPVSTFVFVSRLVRPGWLFETDAMAVIEVNSNPSIRLLEQSDRGDLIMKIWHHTFSAMGLL